MRKKEDVITLRDQLVHYDRSKDRPIATGYKQVDSEVLPGLTFRQVEDSREIFEWDNGLGESFVFDVTSLKRRVEDGRIKHKIVNLPLTQDFMDFLVHKRGIEMWRVEQLEPEYLTLPAIGLMMYDKSIPDWAPITVDGNHRLARRFMDGCPYGQVACILPKHYMPFMLPKGLERIFWERFPPET